METMLATLVPLTILLCLSNATAADPSTARGAALMNACAACHGPGGQSKGAIPSIVTMSKENLVETLQAFRAGTRQGTVMNRIAKGLDDTDINALAAYMAQQRQSSGNR